MINIEVGKSYQKERYKIRIGDIDGCTELSGITEEELIEEIEDRIKGMVD